MSTEKPSTVREFVELEWEGIHSDVDRQVQWLWDRVKDPTAATTQFVRSVKDTRAEPGSVFHGFTETVGHLNKGLGSTFGAVGYHAWLNGVVTAFVADSDALAKTTAVLGVVPVVGDIMGIAEGAVQGNWEQTALSAVGLLVVLAGQVVPLVGEVLDIALGIYMVVTQLIELVKELFGDEEKEIDVARSQRDQMWSKAVAEQAATFIPVMEQGWRRYEQGILSNFAQALAIIDRVARESIRSQPPAGKTQIASSTRAKKVELYSQLISFLNEASAGYRKQMKIALHQLLTDQKTFRSFNERVLERMAGNWATHWFDNCISLGNGMEECLAQQQGHYDDYLKTCGELKNDTVPATVPNAVYAPLEKSFAPRGIPPYVPDAYYNIHRYEYDGYKWSDPKEQPNTIDVYEWGNVCATGYNGWLTYTYAAMDTRTQRCHLEQRAFDLDIDDLRVGVVSDDYTAVRIGGTSTYIRATSFVYQGRLFTLCGTNNGMSHTPIHHELWETIANHGKWETKFVRTLASVNAGGIESGVGLYSDDAHMISSITSQDPLYRLGERVSVDSDGTPEFQTFVNQLAGKDAAMPTVAAFGKYLYMVYCTISTTTTPPHAIWQRYDGHIWSSPTVITPHTGIPLEPLAASPSALCVFDDRLHFAYVGPDGDGDLWMTSLDRDTHKWEKPEPLPKTGMKASRSTGLGLATHRGKLYCFFSYDL